VCKLKFNISLSLSSVCVCVENMVTVSHKVLLTLHCLEMCLVVEYLTSGFGNFLQIFEHILDCKGYSVVALFATVSLSLI
jgi:hypothetical protein